MSKINNDSNFIVRGDPHLKNETLSTSLMRTRMTLMTRIFADFFFFFCDVK